MTRDDIAARARFNLDDSGITFYSADDFNDSIQDGYNEAVALSRTIEVNKTISFVNSLTYYKFGDIISDYIHVIAIFNNNTNKWLDYISLELLKEGNARWETTEGQPKFFTVFEDRYIALYPKQATATGTMLVLYKGTANVLLAATEPTIPDSHQIILEQYTTGDLLEQAEEFRKAQEWQDEYFKQTKQLMQQMFERNNTDRIARLQIQALKQLS